MPNNLIPNHYLIVLPTHDILTIIAKDCPSSEELSFFLNFVEIVYDIFQRNCKDLNELRHLVSLLFPRYLQPVLDGVGEFALMLAPAV